MNIFGKLIDCLGLVTLFALTSLIFYVLYDLARDYLKGKLKIKWLCKHEYIENEYIETFKWWNDKYTEHTYQCRKCGKILEVDVYEHFSLKDDKHRTERK